MRISRVVIKNYRACQQLDINIDSEICCIIGENNVGKSAIFKAIQICVDVGLSSSFRALVREDINATLDITQPSQVLIGLEFEGFEGRDNEEALVATWKMAPDKARIFYRFRPKPSVREALANGEKQPGELCLDDYRWEIKGGGDPAIDLLDIEWNDDGIGETVRFSDLQSFLVVHLPALRDVEGDLRNARQSPLIKLIESFEISPADQDSLVQILTSANQAITSSQSVADVAAAVDARFKDVSGPAFEMDAKLGLSAATFRAILRNLKIILSDLSLLEFEPNRNGLGMNNILYIAILIEYLKRRVALGRSSGQLILLEEPEAHLHPQLQASLISALKDTGVQIILNSHSTQLTSLAPLRSVVSLTKRPDASVAAGNMAQNANLTDDDVADLERYLDATKSNLLFARKVMLVEGAAELFLLPALMEKVRGIKLEREGISLTAIHGVHFQVFAKLFAQGALEKKCAIVADADQAPSDAADFQLSEESDLAELEGEFVKVSLGATTFERELVSVGNLPMLIEAVRHLGAPQILSILENGLQQLQSGNLEQHDEVALKVQLGTAVLNTAKRFGKARFAQVAARYVELAEDLPAYVEDALDWLSE